MYKLLEIFPAIFVVHVFSNSVWLFRVVLVFYAMFSILGTLGINNAMLAP